MAKISAVITVYNEEKNIERCLKSLKFADEIIVVNNTSDDKTEEIAKKYSRRCKTMGDAFDREREFLGDHPSCFLIFEKLSLLVQFLWELIENLDDLVKFL